MGMAPPPPAPELMKELVEEVLLRFPPDDPARLVNAALVCKLWHRLVSGTAFRRRFRKFHRSAAPLLGVIYTGGCKIRHDATPKHTDPCVMPPRNMPLPTAYLVPTTSFRPVHAVSHSHYGWRAIDARHGRVLLCQRDFWMDTLDLCVWDPITDERRHLPQLPFNASLGYSAAVTCADTASGNCDHLDCHRGCFLVVFLDIQPQIIHLFVYSSEAGAWSQLADFKHPNTQPPGIMEHVPSILVGSVLYFLVRSNIEFVKCDLATWEVSTISLPSQFHSAPFRSIVLMTDHDGGLGLAVNTSYQLELWSMVAHGDSGFALRRVIDLQKVLPIGALILNTPQVIGFADCGASRVLFMSTSNDLYNIDINSIQVKKVAKCCENDRVALPYVSFHTPTSRVRIQ